MAEPLVLIVVLVCDLDGTLIDIRERDYRAYRYAIGRIGTTPVSPEAFWPARREGKRIVDFVPPDAPDGDRDVVVKAFVDAVESEELLALDPLFGDTLSFLGSARDSGWRIVVCTLRRRPDAAQRQLDSLGLRARVDEACVVAHGEHAPKASTLLRYAPERTLMVGDTESDILSARRAGVPVFAVTTGVRDRAYLEQHSPDVIADSLSELLPWLKGTDD